jgi:uncharacterized repeat protein (TIGR01451 family)
MVARPRLEILEGRQLLAAPVISPISDVSLPANKTLYVPIQGSDGDGDPISYTVTSSNSAVQAVVRTGHPYLKLSVANHGDMIFQLFDDVAPTTVKKITDLVNQGFYNNLTFHRVVPNFVIQGGDPKGDGTGGPGFTFDDEFNPNAIFDGNGQLAMANSGKDTNGSQFFVTIGNQRLLDFNHTIWGQLVRGQDVLTAINGVATDSSGKPLTPVVITGASIVQDNNDSVLMITAPAGSGSSTITVTAKDPQGNPASDSFQATFQADTTNDPPILGAVASQTTTVGQPISFNLTSTDLEGNAVEYEASLADSATKGTVQLSGSTVTVTPAAGFTGSISVLVGVKQQGATSRGSTANPFDTQTITVNVVNQVITPQGNAVNADSGVATTAAFAHFNASPAGTAGGFSATLEFGDGSSGPGTVVASSQGGYDVFATHTYANPGTYSVGVTIQGPSATSANTTATATVTTPQTTGLAISIVDSPDPVQAGQSLTYTITVTNTGNATAQGVTLTDTLPSGVSFVSASLSPSGTAGGVVTIPVGDLAAGASRSIQIVVNPSTAGSIANQVTATASGGISSHNAELTTVTTASTGSGTGSGSGSGGTTTNDGTGPKVVGLVRRGILNDPTRIDIIFDRPLDPARAEDVRNYLLIGAGEDHQIGTSDDAGDPILSASYDAATFTVTLSPKFRLNWFDVSSLWTRAGGVHGLTDDTGIALDGDRDGTPGGVSVIRFARGVYVERADRLARERAISEGQHVPSGPLAHVMGDGASTATLRSGKLAALFSDPEGAEFRRAFKSLPPEAIQRVEANPLALAAANEVPSGPVSLLDPNFRRGKK